MKVAMWAFFVFFMGIVVIILINIFGNITTTNQQDYTLIKNTVEASMYDAIDKASYRAGFYLCTNEVQNANGVIEFSNKNKYDIILLNNIEKINSYRNCDYLLGEVKLNADVFVESFLRRFAENVNNNKSYRVTVQEVIEYPPKVSVRIDTYNTYNSSGSTTLEFKEGDFNIRNQVDAIFEEK
ncbi:MAG: hypothetical protein IJ501_00465 [Bacilli bacterium]|nr:hypothetical protein [Bacilli bacterium]